MNNLEKYKQLTDNDPDIVIGLNRAIEKAFNQKDIEFIKYVLISHDLEQDRKIYKEESIIYCRQSLEEFILIPACDNNFKDLVQFLFTNELIDKDFLYRSLDYGLIRACQNGGFDVVEYLTTSEDLNKNADISHVNSPLRSACQYGHLNIVKFLLDSPLLKTNANLSDIENIYDFGFLCRDLISENPAQHMFDTEEERVDYINRKMAVLQYLITEKNFKADEDIQEFLQKPENKIIKNIFDAQQLYNELNTNLNNNSSNKKPKI